MAFSLSRKVRWVLAGVLVLGAVAAAWRPGETPASAAQDQAQAGRRLEYTSVGVSSPNIVEAMNNLDKEGWKVFQVIPIWKFNNDAGQNELVPMSYQVFANRPLAPAK